MRTSLFATWIHARIQYWPSTRCTGDIILSTSWISKKIVIRLSFVRVPLGLFFSRWLEAELVQNRWNTRKPCIMWMMTVVEDYPCKSLNTGIGHQFTAFQSIYFTVFKITTNFSIQSFDFMNLILRGIPFRCFLLIDLSHFHALAFARIRCSVPRHRVEFNLWERRTCFVFVLEKPFENIQLRCNHYIPIVGIVIVHIASFPIFHIEFHNSRISLWNTWMVLPGVNLFVSVPLKTFCDTFLEYFPGTWTCLGIFSRLSLIVGLGLVTSSSSSSISSASVPDIDSSPESTSFIALCGFDRKTQSSSM